MRGRRRRRGASWPSAAHAAGPRAASVPLGLADVRGAARRPAARAAHPGELPHRRAHRGHAGADAVGAAPGGLPARPGRRRVPARAPTSTATTCWPATRCSASATRAARTASSCSTRSWPPPTTWSSLYTGADERTGRARPAGGAARRAARRRSTRGDRARAGATVVVRHPLQPFDARNFAPALSAARAVQLRPAALAGARAAAGPRRRAAAVPRRRRCPRRARRPS